MLRIALLAMVEPAGTGPSDGWDLPRAFLRVGGKSLAMHQLANAIDLGCERVICLTREISADLIALQRQAEGAGLRFHAIRNPREMAALVSAQDELLVMTEGLLADTEAARDALSEGNGVLVQSIESGLEAGFERIDINRAAAGLIRVPGRLVEKLHDLPPDCDVASSLTRAALQAGVPMRPLPPAARAGGRWRMIRGEADAHAIEGEWLRHRIGNPRSSSPGRALARFGVLSFGTSLLHSGNAGKVLVLAVLATLAVALGTGWLGQVALGFVLCGVAWILSRAARLIHQVEAGSSTPDRSGYWRILALGVIVDIELVLLSVWGARRFAWETMMDQLFAPLMLILLLRLLPRRGTEQWGAWVGDRAMLSALLAFAAAFGFLDVLIQVLAIGLAIIGVLLSGPAFGRRPRG